MPPYLLKCVLCVCVSTMTTWDIWAFFAQLQYFFLLIFYFSALCAVVWELGSNSQIS